MARTLITLALIAFMGYLALVSYGADPLPYIPVTIPTLAGTEHTDHGAVLSVTVGDKFTYTVVQQPADNPAWVAGDPGVLTQFPAASAPIAAKGVMAHNYLDAGVDLMRLQIGDMVQVQYADGHTITYKVVNHKSYQALSPNDPYSSFIAVDTGKRFSSGELYYYMYDTPGTFVLLTCIEQGGELSWGRQFWVADEVYDAAER